MRRHVLSSLIALVAVVSLASTLAAQAQVAAKPAPAAKAWTMPRTPDGKPDLQGVYSNATTVPVARPANLGAKEFYTDEADKAASAAAGRGGAGRGGAAAARPAAAADPEGNGLAVHYDTSQFGLGGPTVKRAASLRTSIITGPEGRVPALTADAQKSNADRRAFQQAHQWDGPDTRPIAERCITWGFEGPPMMPVGYNSTLQIVQGQGYVGIVQEMIHDTRIIPTDGRSHGPSQIRRWMGDSVGHWEGDTLVVETVNFEPRTPFQQTPFSDVAKVTERFTRIDADTVTYQFTVDDSKTWVKPFSGEYNMVKIDGNVYEYACHEGNYGMANNLSGARATEKK